MKRPTKAQLREHAAQDRRAIAVPRIPVPNPLPKVGEPEPHVISIPIWRAVVVGERLNAQTDVKAGTWGIECIPRDLVDTIFNGQYLYFRRITTVPLTIHIR